MAATDIVTFALRLLLGTLFVAAGVLKAGHFNDLAAAIAGFRVLPEAIVGPLAVLLPFFEIGLGAYLVAGLFTRGAAIVASVQLLIYAAVIASAVVRHIPANCGCFGPQDNAPADWPHVAADAALAAVCAALAWRAPGPFSVDERMGRR
ncbi:MAG TPA: MauE/DoxX family redox-associated membrane protein [Candidatus Baltobacteraceae bacterium]|nr:MauE/DoxX family redox-associated membrane protein [Candidatus Baltobacteraceae bacterium]